MYWFCSSTSNSRVDTKYYSPGLVSLGTLDKDLLGILNVVGFGGGWVSSSDKPTSFSTAIALEFNRDLSLLGEVVVTSDKNPFLDLTAKPTESIHKLYDEQKLTT